MFNRYLFLMIGMISVSCTVRGGTTNQDTYPYLGLPYTRSLEEVEDLVAEKTTRLRNFYRILTEGKSLGVNPFSVDTQLKDKLGLELKTADGLTNDFEALQFDIINNQEQVFDKNGTLITANDINAFSINYISHLEAIADKVYQHPLLPPELLPILPEE